MKNINPLGLFDDHFLLEALSKLGDPLQKLNKYVNWNIFESPINEAFKNEDRDLSKGGRPSFNRLVLFKALIIQSLYNLSDDQLEYQIVDRASFKRFLGLKKSDKVPDSKTFWLFREQLIEKGVILDLFKIFNETLDAAGVLSNQGKIKDSMMQQKNWLTAGWQILAPVRRYGLMVIRKWNRHWCVLAAL